MRALMAVDRGAWSDLTLSSVIRKAGLDPRDAAFSTALCAGVLQNRALLDYQIAAYSSLRLNKISPFVLNVLRAAAYQIMFMDRVPHAAAVNTAVAMIRRSANPKAAGPAAHQRARGGPPTAGRARPRAVPFREIQPSGVAGGIFFESPRRRGRGGARGQ